MEESGDHRDHGGHEGGEHGDGADPIRELIAPYVLGALEPAEVEAVELHLQTCAACRALVDEERRVVGLLPYLARPQPVPLRARRTLFARLRDLTDEAAGARGTSGRLSQPALDEQPDAADSAPVSRVRRWRAPVSIARLGWVAAVVAAALAAIFFWNSQQMQTQVARKNSEISAAQQSQSSLSRIISQHGIVTTLRSTGAAPNAQGGIVLDPTHNAAVVVVSGLPKPPPNESYVVWLVRGNQQTNAGILPVDDQGHATLYISPRDALSTYNGFLITEESGQLAANSSPHGVRMMQAQVGP